MRHANLCLASAALNTVGDYRFLGIMPVRILYEASHRIGRITTRELKRAGLSP